MTGASSRPGLSDRVRGGDIHALARLLTLLENDDPIGQQALERLYPYTGKAHVVGITGPPGGGKSTLVNELIRGWRERSQRVAVIAIDPSSPFTGGATLGDRIRMQEWHADPDVFIRSMASRQFGGGLAQNALALASAFDAAGFDPIVIETVGTGQDEVAIASLAMTTLLAQVPGTGDSVQTLKAGSLEIGDVLVVTKGDRPEASELARDLRNLRQLGIAAGTASTDWEVPVVRTSALRREGIDSLIEAIGQHRVWLDESGEMAARLRRISTADVTARVHVGLRTRLQRLGALDGEVHDLVDAVTNRRTTPHQAATAILSRLLPERRS